MASVPIKTMRKSLKKKGFIFQKGIGDHDWYYYSYNGKEYRQIAAKISRGSGYKDYPDSLLQRMKNLLHLDSLQEVRQLLLCPMDAAEYKAILDQKNML